MKCIVNHNIALTFGPHLVTVIRSSRTITPDPLTEVFFLRIRERCHCYRSVIPRESLDNAGLPLTILALDANNAVFWQFQLDNWQVVLDMLPE
ncbi:hypothetical protein BV898_13616 [Hypsibius exemplaris]|uniref:Uncharacterized protein n=1 Tax=Hypsibius exemplaris TaxID=2072580 RepID=A0A1W0WAE0_HYPEX|nr:hypothetical protein BV898_13616 [Hypsibius exemplaris]